MVRRSTPASVEAEKRFPVRVRLATPPQGLGTQLNLMHVWLDEHIGRGNYASHGFNRPGQREASLWYFLDVGHAKAFVDRFACEVATDDVR